jgi:outer membrane biogenesis lipoprotein LolB
MTGCAARRIALPSDLGAPFPDFNQVHAQVSMACSGVRTLTTELGLSGRAGAERLRGRVVAGFARPDSMRLEGVAPFGAPAFILAARGNMATLVLPRDNHVLRGAKAEEILGALTGVSLAPADLQAILTGCVVAMPRASAGHLHNNGWASIDLDGGATVYLQRQGSAWQVRAARRSGWQIEYPTWQGMFPQMVRLRSDDARANVDLSASIGQLETNVTLEPQAFTVSIPADAMELTLDELRQSGPLRGQ